MSGHLHGLAAQIKEIVPTSIYTHCFAHRLNLCLHDSTRINPTIRASLDLCSQIAKLCRSSPDRVVISESLMSNLSTSQSVASIKPICLIRRTVNSEALHGIIDNYPALLQCFTYVAEVNHNNDYGIVAEGVLHQMNHFKSFLGVKLSYLIFSATDHTSKCLQNKSCSVEAVRQAVEIAIGYLKRTNIR